tara:strand:+ start:1 stop:1257 length:1257 start_codon:yes stop_codon:yes gene_type:complete
MLALDGATSNATFAGDVIMGKLTATKSGTAGVFNSGTTNVVASFTSTDGTGVIQLADDSGNVEIGAAGNDFVVQPAGGVAQLTVGSSSSTFAGTVTVGASNKIEIKNESYGSAIRYYQGTDYWLLYHYTDNSFRFQYNGVGSDEIIIDTSGGATFAGTVTATDALIATGSYPGLSLTNPSNTRFALTNRHTDNRMSFDVTPQGGSTVEVMDLTSNGLGIGRRTASYKLTLISNATTQNGVYISAGTGSGNHSLYVENQDSSAEYFAVRGDGEIRFNATSGHTYAHTGIRFGTNASANNLDDYEEGTFTATTNNDGVGQPVTANYTKIGQLVTYTVYIPSWSPTSAGTAVIAGFPFTAIITNGYGVGNVTHSTGVLNCSGGYHETTNWNGTLNNSTGRSSWVVASARSIMVTGFYYTTA